MDIGREVIREAEQEQADRSNFDSLWTEVARRVHTRADNFQGRNVTEGARRTEWQFDSTAALALERFAAVIIAMTMPPSEKYHSFQAEAREARKDISVRKWCESVRDEVFSMRYSSHSNFTGNLNEATMDYGAFGTGTLMLEDKPGSPPNYRSCGLHNTFHCEGENGKINRTFRKLQYKPYQAIEKFGANNLPEIIIKSLDTKPNEKFNFWHRTQPRKYVQPGIRGPEGMAFESVYVSENEKKLVEQGGYRTFPYAVMRGPRSKNEIYGRSPALTVLADIKMKNEMARSTLRATHRMTEPTLLLADDAALAPFSLRPGHRNKGYLSEDGTELAKQMKWEGDLNAALKMLEMTDIVIKDAFLMRVFELMLTNPNMTATEVLERLRERGVLLTPAGGQIQNEFLGALAEREIDILSARGKLDEMPELLLRYGGKIELTDNSPLGRAQRAGAAIGFSRTVEQIIPLAQVDPTLMQRFKAEDMLPELAEIHGMPLNWLYTNDEFALIQQANEREKAMQTALGAAQPVAAAAKDAAQARLFSQQAGQ